MHVDQRSKFTTVGMCCVSFERGTPMTRSTVLQYNVAVGVLPDSAKQRYRQRVCYLCSVCGGTGRLVGLRGFGQSSSALMNVAPCRLRHSFGRVCLIVVLLGLGWFQDRYAKKIDLDEQTSAVRTRTLPATAMPLDLLHRTLSSRTQCRRGWGAGMRKKSPLLPPSRLSNPYMVPVPPTTARTIPSRSKIPIRAAPGQGYGVSSFRGTAESCLTW